MVDRLVKRTDQSWATLNALATYCKQRYGRAASSTASANCRLPNSAYRAHSASACDSSALEEHYGRQLEQMGNKLKEELARLDESLGYRQCPPDARQASRSILTRSRSQFAVSFAARPRTLPPVVLRMVQDTAQMGSMRCQLKSQIDAEVVEALMELVNSDRTPSKPLRGMSSVTGACLVRPQ